MLLEVLGASPTVLARVALATAAAYLVMVLVLRASGKRTLTKWNAFDFVVTVALGSALATIALSRDVSVAAGATAVVTLVIAQLVVTWTAVRWRWFDDLVKARPTLLLRDGKLDEAAMRRERVSEAEIWAALRGHGIGDPAEAEAVVLETDGSFSVVRRDAPGDRRTLDDVRGW